MKHRSSLNQWIVEREREGARVWPLSKARRRIFDHSSSRENERRRTEQQRKRRRRGRATQRKKHWSILVSFACSSPFSFFSLPSPSSSFFLFFFDNHKQPVLLLWSSSVVAVMKTKTKKKKKRRKKRERVEGSWRGVHVVFFSSSLFLFLLSKYLSLRWFVFDGDCEYIKAHVSSIFLLPDEIDRFSLSSFVFFCRKTITFVHHGTKNDET